MKYLNTNSVSNIQFLYSKLIRFCPLTTYNICFCSRLRSSYTLLQNELPDIDFATLIIENMLDESNLSDIQSTTGVRRKKSKLLKIIIMKGTPACEELFKAIEIYLKRRDLIQKMKSRSDEILRRGNVCFINNNVCLMK